MDTNLAISPTIVSTILKRKIEDKRLILPPVGQDLPCRQQGRLAGAFPVGALAEGRGSLEALGSGRG